jgi:dTDP-glucose 4,6-dehydratase
MKTIVTGSAGFLGSHLCDLLLDKGHHNMDTRIVRIFNTYGPQMRAGDGRVVPNFINQALRGEDITVYGDGLRIVFEELPVDDPKVRRLDIGRAKDVLGWEPEVGLGEGLERTLEYFEKLYMRMS